MKRLFLTIGVVAVAAALPVPAADPPKFDAAAAAKLLAPFLDEQTIAVSHAAIAAIDLDSAFEKVAKYTGQDPADLAKGRHEGRDFQAAFTRAGGRDAFAVFSIADLPRHAPIIVVPVPTGANAAALRKALEPLNAAVVEERHGVLVACDRRQQERLKANRPAARPDLAAALAAAGDADVRAAIIPGDDQLRVAAEIFPTLPPQLGGRPVVGLIRGTRWASFSATVKPALNVTLRVQMKDDATAKDLEGLASAAMTVGRLMPDVRRNLPGVDQIAAALQPKVDGAQVRVLFDESAPGVAEASAALMQAARRRARVGQSVNNLKQIALAMHGYTDVQQGKLPAHAIYSKDGTKPLLSWRVAILPFIEHDNLYKQFKLDEPWDSEHNKKLIPLMPVIYQGPAGRAEAGKTHYQLFVGGGAPWERSPKTPGIPRSFPDGMSNTILIAEAADAVTWTKPDDLAYDPAGPLPKLGADPAVGALIALADGSVRVLGRNITEKTLRAAITAAGNETLGADW